MGNDITSAYQFASNVIINGRAKLRPSNRLIKIYWLMINHKGVYRLLLKMFNLQQLAFHKTIMAIVINFVKIINNVFTFWR